MYPNGTSGFGKKLLPPLVASSLGTSGSHQAGATEARIRIEIIQRQLRGDAWRCCGRGSHTPANARELGRVQAEG